MKSIGGIALLYSRTPTERKRDGRLGGEFLLIINFIVLLASPLLHSRGANYGQLFTVIAVFSLIGLIGLKVPWDKADHRANVIITLSIFSESAALSPQLHHATSILPVLMLAGFFYAGMVQDPRLLILNGTFGFLVTFFYMSADSPVTWVLVGPITTLAGLMIAGLLVHNRMLAAREDRIRNWQLKSMSEVGSTTLAFDTLAFVASSCNEILRGTGGVAVTWLQGQGAKDILISTSFNGTDLALLASPNLLDGSEKESGFFVSAQSNEYVFVENAALSNLDREAYRVFKYSSCIFFPLKMGSNRLGSVAVYWHRWMPRPSDEVIDAIGSFLDEASRIVAAQLDREDLTERLAIDELTRLNNRRSFFSALNLIEAGDSIVFLDLDNFKMLNDTLGHSEGDKELRAFGHVLKSLNRGGDLAARYGGEEFVLILKGSNELDSHLKVEQIRGAWSSVGRVTFSAGIATMVEGSNSAAVLICADRAMYAAKSNGRNRTETIGVSESALEGGDSLTM
ncbi:MAG: GGDEF domain-containing protein [Actinomycetota bacterium]|nr:GGDEF domain-containing protein [Actinomycetota bacterium]